MSHGGGTLKPLRIYVGGKYNDEHVFKILNNMRVGIKYSIAIFNLGHYPYSPWLDYPFIWLGEGELDCERLYDLSMAWLKVSEAMFVVPGWETSKGTKAEIKEAESLGIPIYYNLEDIPEVDE
jgi:hypothetical protein